MGRRIGGKYNIKKVHTPEGIFDSGKEYDRWLTLQLMQASGKISDLHRQQEFELLPAQDLLTPIKTSKSGRMQKKLNGLKYIADFTYYDSEGHLVVEDVKPTDKDGFIKASYKKTPAWREYMVKKKLMLAKGIQIVEV